MTETRAPRFSRNTRHLIAIVSVIIFAALLLLLIVIPSRSQMSNAKSDRAAAASVLHTNTDRLAEYRALLRNQETLQVTSDQLTTEIPSSTDQQGALVQISAAASEAGVQVTNVTWQTPERFKTTIAKTTTLGSTAIAKRHMAILRQMAADTAFKAIPVQIQTSGTSLEQSKILLQNLQGMQRLFWANQVQTTTGQQTTTGSSSSTTGSGSTTTNSTPTVQTTVNGYLFSYAK